MNIPVTPGKDDGGRDARRVVHVPEVHPRLPAHMLYMGLIKFMYVMRYRLPRI